MLRGRRPLWAGTLAVLGSLVVVTPHATAETCHPHGLTVWRISRTTRQARMLTLRATITPLTETAMVFAVTTKGSGAARAVVNHRHSVVVDGTRTVWPEGYASPPAGAHGIETEPPPSALCAATNFDEVPTPLMVTSAPVTYDYYVGVYDAKVALQISPGWRATLVHGGAMHIVAGAAGGTGVQAWHAQVEHFTGTQRVPGGRWGSVAFGSIPCQSIVAAPVVGAPPTGVGTGRLRGGRVEHPTYRTMDCLTGIHIAEASTSGPTNWYVEGDATGTSAVTVRLAVFDLPRP